MEFHLEGYLRKVGAHLLGTLAHPKFEKLSGDFGRPRTHKNFIVFALESSRMFGKIFSNFVFLSLAMLG